MPKGDRRPRGRPLTFSEEIGAAVCARLAAGETLRAICRDEAMPPESTVRGWALDIESFGAQYARAREIGYQSMFDEILEIADTPRIGVKTKTTDMGVETVEGDMIEHRRLQVDARKWALSKALPKVYGDKLELGGKDGGPISLHALIVGSMEKPS